MWSKISHYYNHDEGNFDAASFIRVYDYSWTSRYLENVSTLLPPDYMASHFTTQQSSLYTHYYEPCQKRRYYVIKLQNLWTLLYLITSTISIFLDMLEISRNRKWGTLVFSDICDAISPLSKISELLKSTWYCKCKSCNQIGFWNICVIQWSTPYV
jgi:hypothetical protein